MKLIIPLLALLMLGLTQATQPAIPLIGVNTQTGECTIADDYTFRAYFDELEENGWALYGTYTGSNLEDSEDVLEIRSCTMPIERECCESLGYTYVHFSEVLDRMNSLETTQDVKGDAGDSTMLILVVAIVCILVTALLILKKKK